MKFNRIQFRVSLVCIREALVTGGICTPEDLGECLGYSDDRALFESLGIKNQGRITFTWLEPELFFLNDVPAFSKIAEVSITLRPLASRVSQIRGELWDCIELRPRETGYELALIKAENREGWARTEAPSLKLMELPYSFFHSLQNVPKSGILRHFDKQKQILESTGLKYWQDSEVSSAWDFRGKYASIHWRTL